MTVYPWISESFKIIQPILPCSKNEAVAKLVEMLPQRAVDAALCGKCNSRFRAANLAVRHLTGSRLKTVNGLLVELPVRDLSRGHAVLDKLKTHRAIREDETGFQPGSIRTYRIILRNFGWITISEGSWYWTGPDDANWSAVTQENRRKKT